MSRAYVETTVLADALLKPGACAKSAKAGIGRFKESLLPVYSIKEFKAGPLKHYVWLHGKLVTTKSWEQTLAQLRKTAMSPFLSRWVSTAIEALAAGAHTNRTMTLGHLVAKYGAFATEDAVLCDRYRYTLHSIIMRGWRTRRALTSKVVDELECYPEADVFEERGLIELGDVLCRPKYECCLANELRARPELLLKMLQAIEAQPTKAENVKRSQVLRDLVRLRKHRLTPKQCRHLGDAIFAFFCPADATILTTNTRDLVPLAQAVGKTAEAP